MRDDAMNRTLVVIPHYGPDRLIHELFQSAGFSFPADAFQGDLSLVEQPAYSFLIVNNNNQNLGFTVACNAGLARLKTSEFRYAWLLNNDTAFESRDQFEHGLEVMQSLSESRGWAIVAQQVRDFSTGDAIIFGGSLECYPAGRHKSGRVSRGDWQVPSEERWLSFCSVLVRRDLVERVGPMDESMVNYYSDSDYSLTARQAGFKLGYAGKDSFVFHKTGQSSNPGEAQKPVLRQDHMAFWNKWIGGDLHSIYLALMTDPSDGRHWRADELGRQADAYPELKMWLKSFPAGQEIRFRDILDHFQYRKPPTPFSTLCNIAAELCSPG